MYFKQKPISLKDSVMREYREEIEDGDQKDGCLNHKFIFNIFLN